MTIEQLLLIIIAVLVVIALLFGIIAGLLLAIYKKGTRSRPNQVITTQRRTDDKLAELDKLLEPATSQAVPQTPAITAPAKTTALDKETAAPVAVAAPVKKATPPADGLSQEQTEALNVMMSDVPAIFLTGAAGTGKSYLLKQFRKVCPLNCVVLAPTGMAALNAGGQTIHSFFGFPLQPLNRDEIKVVRNRRLYEMVDLIIIDEVSMVRADMMDNIEAFMRMNGRDSHKPFGGTRVIFVGDLYQLPPIVEDDQIQKFLQQYNSQYFYSAEALSMCPVQIIELNEIHRQNDRDFIDVLNAIRIGQIKNTQIAWLNSITKPVSNPSHSITLTPTKKSAYQVNQEQLGRLEGEERLFKAIVEGDESELLKNKQSFPVELELKIKKGAQVVFVKNDIEHQWVNGTLGVVVGIRDDEIDVRITGGPNDGMEVRVVRDTWAIIKYSYDSSTKRIESKEVAAIEQFPLALAWAMTIHKSQGATYDFVNVDLGNGAFAEGQTYVALSRCRTPQGLSLAKPLRHSDIKVDSKLATWREDISRAQGSGTFVPVPRWVRSLSSESANS